MNRILGFDGLRALSVGAVLIYHLTNPNGSYHQLLAEGSKIGVYVFFVLSGMMITSLLRREKMNIVAQRSSFSQGVIQFFSRRFIRIAPIYYLVIILGFLFGIEEVKTGVFWHVCFTTNLWIGFKLHAWPGYVSPFWSLGVEWQYYVLAAFVFLVCPMRSHAGILVGLILLSVGLHAWMSMHFMPKIMLDTCSPLLFPLFALGGLTIILKPEAQSRCWQAVLIGAMGVLFLMGCYALGVSPFEPLTKLNAYTLLKKNSILFLYFTAIASLVGVIYLNQKTLMTRCLEIKPIAYIGTISYGIYIYHVFVFGFCNYFAPNVGLNSTGSALISAVMTLSIAALSWKYIEAPLIASLKNKRPLFPPHALRNMKDSVG